MEYLRNKKATFDYQIGETMETGIELLGTEVKSLKNHHGSLSAAYITIIDEQLALLGAHIPAWQEKNIGDNYDPYRTRKLLVHKKEIVYLKRKIKEKGLTLVPISLYNKNNRIKLQIALARGKKLFNKKESLKARDLDREEKRSL